MNSFAPNKCFAFFRFSCLFVCLFVCLFLFCFVVVVLYYIVNCNMHIKMTNINKPTIYYHHSYLFLSDYMLFSTSFLYVTCTYKLIFDVLKPTLYYHCYYSFLSDYIYVVRSVQPLLPGCFICCMYPSTNLRWT
jgi:hypothetical protein